MLHGLTGARFAARTGRSTPRALLPAPRRASSAAFAVAAELALLMLGGALKRRESLSGRLGDVLSKLYLASAVLKQFSDQGGPDG